MMEEWRDIVDFEGRYQVSNLGQVRSLARVEPYGRWGKGGLRTVKGGIRRQTWSGSDKSRFLSVSVKDATGKLHSLKVHLCVLTTFQGPRPSSEHDGCHNDGDRANNALSNLRWDTKSGNNQDKVAHGTHNKGVRNNSAKLTEDDVRNMRLHFDDGATLQSQADRFAISVSTAGKIRARQLWKHVT